LNQDKQGNDDNEDEDDKRSLFDINEHGSKSLTQLMLAESLFERPQAGVDANDLKAGINKAMMRMTSAVYSI
jgi:hypothetical protein